jgi:hypothetical protein
VATSLLKRLTILVAGLSAAVPALANGAFESAYTKLDLAKCKAEPANPDDPVAGGTWWCEGYGDMPVRVAEGDLRFLVSYGANAAEEPAAGETLPAFNTIGTTLEWRLERDRSNGSLTPIATILRYFTDSGTGTGEKGQVLVVTKLGGPGQVCHIGYVDALLNSDANVMARQVAEQAAAGFVCGQDRPGIYGLAKQ